MFTMHFLLVLESGYCSGHCSGHCTSQAGAFVFLRCALHYYPPGIVASGMEKKIFLKAAKDGGLQASTTSFFLLWRFETR